jgi:predicted metalloendopeptidase
MPLAVCMHVCAYANTCVYENRWSQPVREKFMKRASCIRRLYDNFEIAGKKVKGGRSLGEDIADMGGLGIAYSAYRLWYNMTYYTVRSSKGVLSVRHRSDILPFNDNKIMSEEGQNDENMTMDNEPPEAGKRLFFIAFGQNWCAKTRRENVLNNEVNSDHAPWPFRCNGVVSQMEDFSQVFHCPVGSPMHPYNRCVMWREIEDGHRGLGLTGLQATNSRMHLKARIGRLSGPQPAWDF